MKKLLCLVVTAVAVSLAAPAYAQFAKPESAVKYRQAAMAVMGNHAGRLGAVAQGKVPYSRDAVVRSAEIIQFMSKLPYEAFTPGSDMVSTTKAKPEIWSNEAEFKKLASDMQEQVNKLVDAAKAGTVDALRPAVKATVDACNACHDKFQQK
jgi:cytochrome c556